MKQQTVWILMYQDNDYNQPEKAFECLWWHKPTFKDLQPFGFTEEEADKGKKFAYSRDYWVECHSK